MYKVNSLKCFYFQILIGILLLNNPLTGCQIKPPIEGKTDISEGTTFWQRNRQFFSLR